MILVVAVDSLGPDVVFADGLDAGTVALRRVHAVDPDFRDAELLASEPVALDAVAIITVANEKVRDTVRNIFANAGITAPRIAVFPPAFLPTE